MLGLNDSIKQVIGLDALIKTYHYLILDVDNRSKSSTDTCLLRKRPTNHDRSPHRTDNMLVSIRHRSPQLFTGTRDTGRDVWSFRCGRLCRWCTRLCSLGNRRFSLLFTTGKLLNVCTCLHDYKVCVFPLNLRVFIHDTKMVHFFTYVYFSSL